MAYTNNMNYSAHFQSKAFDNIESYYFTVTNPKQREIAVQNRIALQSLLSAEDVANSMLKYTA